MAAAARAGLAGGGAKVTDASGSAPDLTRRQLGALHEASLAIAADLSVDTVLQRIVDLARSLIGARYAALGVADDSGRITDFWTSGITAEQRAAIGPLPHGRGLLGVLIRERATLRVSNIAADPRSSGFPAHHPTMTNLLGTPLVFQDRVLGDLYLTDKIGAVEFTADDEWLVSMLAAQAAVAIANAQLYASMQRQYQRADAQRRQLQGIIDSIPSAVVIADDQGRRVMINAAGRALFGDLAPDLNEFGMPFTRVTAFVRPDGLKYPVGHLPLDVAMRDAVVLHDIEVMMHLTDGQRRTILSNTAPLLDSDGRVTGGVAVFRDITAFKEADQLKDDFLSLVSHELRTPLTTIHGGALTLLRHHRQLDEATLDSLLGDIAGESERLMRLVGNVLDLSRIRAGRLRLETEPFLIEPLLRRVVEAMAPKLAGLTVTMQPGGTLPPVEGDPDRIEQVLRNLLENAGKYVPAGGHVMVQARTEPAAIVVTVADDGPGIPANQIDRVFERFHRVDDVSSPTSGVGLGLYLSRHLVEAHGGHLWVDSLPGKGSAFSFSLPCAT